MAALKPLRRGCPKQYRVILQPKQFIFRIPFNSVNTSGDKPAIRVGPRNESGKGRSENKRSAWGDMKSTNTIRKKKSKHQPSIQEMFDETAYYFKDGIRYVYPYHYLYKTHVKKRWLNKTLRDVLNEEFPMAAANFYENAIFAGKIGVNGKFVNPDTILSHNDILESLIHRHEAPVLDREIEFCWHDDEMVVINKPPSIPVHPTAAYRHNTITIILAKEYGLQKLFGIHRIDRLTSGILMFAKTKDKAEELHKLHREGTMKKEYLARVVGEFPEEEITVNEPLIRATHELKVGVCHVHEDGKSCSTTFKCLSFNGKSSVVSCKPRQGRMHQIRVHLQWLGYPIINDPIYNHPTAWGENKGKTKHNMDVVIRELLYSRKAETYFKTDKPISSSLEIQSPYNKDMYFSAIDIGVEYYDKDCIYCNRIWKKPLLSDMVMYLHSLRYKGSDWDYKTSVPDWAKGDWVQD